MTAAQLERAGVGRRSITSAVAAGLLVRVHPTVYCLGGRPLSELGRIKAALVAAGPDALASHTSAALVWDLLPGPTARRPGVRAAACTVPTGPVHLSIPEARRLRLAGVVVHRRRDFPELGRAHWAGVRMTTPMRAVVDLAAVQPELLDAAIDAGVLSRLFSVDGLLAEADRMAGPGHRGVTTLRAALRRRGFTGAPAPSELERRTRVLLGRHGIAIAGVEVVELGGRYRVDVVLVSGLRVEVLGYRWHALPEALNADAERLNALVLSGLRVVQFTWYDVVARPAYVVATLGRASCTGGSQQIHTARPLDAHMRPGA